ncbi:MAG: Chromate resistance protein ChrB [Anaerolineaceae bacterium]
MMNWFLFLSQLPSNPSSLRVTVWRKMRAAGALGIQNGVWILPDNPEQALFLQDLSEIIQKQGAGCQVFSVCPMTEAVENDILERFRKDREEEYTEFLERSDEFLAEIEKESRKQKFTYAELEENEQDLQRLSNWLEKIQKRDFTGGDISQIAKNSYAKCQTAFEGFSTEVYNRNTDTDVPAL